MSNSGYQAKIYRKQGASELVVADGGRITVEAGGFLNLIAPNGSIWFVDANVSASGDGMSWGQAFKTMAEAFAVLTSGDTVFFRGKIREQLITPVQVFDVTIVGAGNRPRHADSTPDGGQDAANTWTYPASGATTAALCKVLQQGWRFVNILFASPTDHAGLWFFRDAGADDAERDASHAEVLGCRFAAGLDGIRGTEVFNVHIADCIFYDHTGYAIKHVSGAGVAAPYRWTVENNRFDLCANWMGAWTASHFVIRNNVITNITTLRLDTRLGDHNVVVGNVFDIAAADFDNSGEIYGAATDVWSNTLLEHDRDGRARVARG